jgi:hypothetical protein
MAKKQISVCEICEQKECSGVIYETEDMWGSYGHHIGKKKVCASDPNLFVVNGVMKYKLVSGHGDYTYYNIFKF